MNKDTKFFTPMILLVLLVHNALVGCSSLRTDSSNARLMATAQVPVPTGYLLSTQPKMQALQHWDNLAAKVAEHGSKALGHFFPQGGVAVFVPQAGHTPFAKALRESLLTHLVAYGVPTAPSPEGAIILEVNVNFLAHARTLTKTAEGVRMSLEPGFRQLKDDQGAYRPLPLVAEESGQFSAQTPDGEIQVNSSFTYQGSYLYRDSSIFYVESAQWPHYVEQPPPGAVQLKKFSLVNK
ncbi:MAG: hypothetical protein GXY42_11865 [Desulfovibrionales bacterium]|nr:hypothetical protein [Desulfovibrionales bacterium]